MHNGNTNQDNYFFKGKRSCPGNLLCYTTQWRHTHTHTHTHTRQWKFCVLNNKVSIILSSHEGRTPLRSHLFNHFDSLPLSTLRTSCMMNRRLQKEGAFGSSVYICVLSNPVVCCCNSGAEQTTRDAVSLLFFRSDRRINPPLYSP